MTANIETAETTLHALLEAMQTFVAIVEVDGTVSFANKIPLQAAGLETSGVLGKKFWECDWFNYNPEIQALMRSYVLRAAAGENINEEIQANSATGLLWTSFKIQPVIKDGKISQLVAEGNDISEQRQLREESRAAQLRMQGMLDCMRAMVAILDTKGHIILINSPPLQVANLEQQDVLGQHLWKCPWFKEDHKTQADVKRYVEAAIAGGSALGDILINTSEGRRWLEFSVHPVFDEQGKVIQLVAEGSDPSARRLVEEEREQALLELQKREQNLAITLNSIGDAVITTDAEGLITRMNPIAEQLTGWSFDEACQQPLSSIFSIFNAHTGEPLASPVDKLMATGQIVHLSNHTTLHARNGKKYQIADSAAPIRDNKGQILGSILVFSNVTEQYRLREQAKATQLQLQRLFDDMHTMVGIFDLDGTMTFINNTPLLVTGYTQEDVIGKKIWECPWIAYNSESVAIVRRDMQLAAAGENTTSDMKSMTLTGEIWVALSAHPIFDDNQQVVQIVAEARDITARKATETDLYISEQRLRRYRDQAPLAAIEWDTQYCIAGWNSAAEKFFGYSLAEVKGQLFSTLLPPDVEVDPNSIWDNLTNQHGGETVFTKVLTKDGETIYTQWHNAAFYDDEGTVIGAASIILDLTNERAAQSALLDTEKTQREILDSMVEGIIVFDETGAILSVNLAGQKVLGYSTEELVGQHVTTLLVDLSVENWQYNMQRYLDSGDIRHIGMGVEVEVISKNHHTFPTLLAVAVLNQSSNGKRRFITSFRDLSGFKQQEEQLRRSQKMDALGKLTGGIAHDFNNMLGIVTGYADLLEQALLNEEKLAQYAYEIRRAGERGANLTRKLLSFSQQKAVSADTVNINELIKNQQHMLETSLTPRIKLVYELGSELWPIRLDSDDLEDAIINICINAMHAIEANGQVTIRTENVQLHSVRAHLKNLPSGDYLQLRITDTGKGMDEETKQRIFDPFYTTKGEQGTGLGLSQVYGFVERSRGAIDVTSVPGQGTQISLYFPRDNTQINSQEISITTHQEGWQGKETILVVDDETRLLDMCAEILSQQGYKVLSAKNCSEALQLLKSHKVDLMFSDVVMPDMDGYELALIVAEKYPEIKIQMTSGFTDDRQSAMTVDSLHQSLLAKPYRAKSLLTKIRELLDS